MPHESNTVKWPGTLSALAKAGYHAIAPDLRGYGETDIPDTIESYSTITMTEDICGLLDALHAEKAVIIGHDIGAHIAWLFAELYPQRVSAVVGLSVAWHPRADLSPSQLVRRAAGGNFSMFQYFLEPGVAESELETDIRDSLRRFLHSLSGDTPADLVSYLFTGKPAELKLLDGMQDFTILPKLRKLVILPSCGHWVQEEQPKAVTTAIIDFLQQEDIR